MKNMKITIIGNSVAIRNRPPKKYPDNKNYGAFLEDQLQNKYSELSIYVNNMAFSRATILNVVERIEDYIASMPNYYIINLGVSDASTREIPYWMAEIINDPKKSLFKNLLSGFHHYIIKPKRSLFVKLRGKKSWISRKTFKKNLTYLIQILKKETNAKLIFLPINPTNDRIENEVPGSSENYKKYNKLIGDVVEDYGCPIIKIDDLDPLVHFPDGIHYSNEGNAMIAKKLFETIKEDIDNAE